MYKLNTYMRMQYVFLGEYVSRNTSELEKVKNMKKRTTRNMVNIFHKQLVLKNLKKLNLFQKL